MLRSRAIAGANVVGFGVNASTFAMWFFITLYLQGIQRYSALKAGLAFQPMTLVVIIGTFVGSRVVLRLGVRSLLMGPSLLRGRPGLAVDARTAHAVLARCVPAGRPRRHGDRLVVDADDLAATSDVEHHEAGLASDSSTPPARLGASGDWRCSPLFVVAFPGGAARWWFGQR